MSSFGIDLFLNDRPTFKGKIKQKCEYFEVREIELKSYRIASFATEDKFYSTELNCDTEKLSPRQTRIANHFSSVDKQIFNDDNEIKFTNDDDSRREAVVKNGSTELIANRGVARKRKLTQEELKSEHPISNYREESDKNRGGCDSSANVGNICCGVDKFPISRVTDLPQLNCTNLVHVDRKSHFQTLAHQVIEELLELSQSNELHVFGKNRPKDKPLDSKRLSFDISSVTVKEDRRKLHQAIRYLYPDLVTDVSRVVEARSLAVYRNEVYYQFLSVLTEEECNSLFRLIYCQDYSASPTLRLFNKEDRTNRTELHRLISKHFGTVLESKTYKSDDFERQLKASGDDNQSSAFISIRLKARTFMDKREKGKEACTNFVLQKVNCETYEASLRLSRIFGCPVKALSFAGTKDKRAVTFQWFSVMGKTSMQLKRYEGQHGNLRIGCFIDTKQPLRLGDLEGNLFTVRIRDLNVPVLEENSSSSDKDGYELMSKLISNTVEDVLKRGYVNYFGTQRFGFEENEVSSPDIGLAILKGDFIRAVELILTPKGLGDEVDKAKLVFVETRDVEKTLQKMPSYKHREVTLLKALKRHGLGSHGCTKSLYSLPYTCRLMYIHSYISLIWNRAATERLIRYGRTVVEGDLVMITNVADPKYKFSVHVVTHSDLTAKRFDVSDVILPLPGYNTQYPANNLVSFYHEQLNKDGLTDASFRIKELGLNVPGTYRRLLTFPRNLQWRLVDRDNEVCPFENNDLSLAAAENTDTLTKSGSWSGSDADSMELGSAADSSSSLVFFYKTPASTYECLNFLAAASRSIDFVSIPYDLVLRFMLPVSSYATVFIREVMKE